jgi:hypothetical protein
MAHFARIDSNNIVQEVIVVNNDVVIDENGDEQEALGQAFIASLGMEGTWLQCSYNGNFRGLYPGVGFTYDSELDQFVAPFSEEIPEEEQPSEA